MTDEVNDAITIARRATAGAGLPFARQANSQSVIDARRYFDLAKHLFLRVPGAAALCARVFHQLASALAGGTRRLHSKDAARLHHLPSAAAVTARFWARARLGAGAFAFGAKFVTVE